MGLFSRKKNQAVDSGPSKRASRVESDAAAEVDDAEDTVDAGAESGAPEPVTTRQTEEAEPAPTRRGRRRSGKADDDAADKSGPLDRTDAGPYDEAEVRGDTARVDLGSLRIPAVDGMQLGLDVDENEERILSVTCDFGDSTLQLQAFAAPRSEGLWHEIRHQIASSVTKQGGTADTPNTSFGPEVLARIPARTGDGRTGVRQARFVGVDGPRWFLRAVIGGNALTDDAERASVEDVLRGVVVVRGDEPMAPRDLLPLTPPITDDEPEVGEPEDTINPFRRGPEITEVR